jgi:hypothetical protein
MIKNYLFTIFLFLIISFAPLLAQAQNEKDFSINGLPTIYIDLKDPAGIITKEDKLLATMRIENAYGSNYDEKELYNGLIEISGRGNSTWTMPKKPYNLDLVDDEGEDNPAPLLGMPADEEWAIIANYSDKSLLRIPFAYYMGNAIGMEYSPRTRFAEVYLNNEYLGLYCLCEKIKKADDRVDVKKLTDKAEDQVEPNITGGYIVEVTPPGRIEPDEKYVTSDRGISYVFKYPKKKKITNEQIAWFGQYINTVESVLYGPDFKDPEKGYRQYIDVPSFVDYYIINDLAKNGDANFFSSVFLYKDRGGKLKMGPIWDFDIAFGNVNYNLDATIENGFYIKQGRWFNRLVQDEYFQQKVTERFDQLKPLFDSMPAKIVAAADSLKSTGAIDRNFQKWPILGSYVWPNFPPYPGTYDGEIRRLTDWFKSRVEWMNIYLPADKAEQCLRLQNTRPHISIVNTDEFDTGAITQIKATRGYNKYFWNGKEQISDTMVINPGGKYWVQVEDDQGCKSLISDTLYYIKKAEIIVDSSVFAYEGTPKPLYTSTIPKGLPVKFTYSGDSTTPITPGEYEVKAVINSSFYKDSITTSLSIKKAQQHIVFPQLPSLIYVSNNVQMNATASSGLPVQYIVSGNGIIKENKLEASAVGQLKIQAIQPGNQFYEAADTLSQQVWAEYPNNFNKNIQIFPAPFNNSVTVIYPYAEQTHLAIYTSRGKRLKEYLLTGKKAILNLGFLAKGVYIFHFENSKGKGDFKVVKQ